jgi:hypothetical protein
MRRRRNYCGWALLVPSFGGGMLLGLTPLGPTPPGEACPPAAPGLGRKTSMFVCARTPLSPGFSMLESGMVTCPPPDDACAYALGAVSNGEITAIHDKQYDNTRPLHLQNTCIRSP